MECIDIKFSYNYSLRFNYLSWKAFQTKIEYLQSNIELYRKDQEYKSMPCNGSRCSSCQFINDKNTIISKTYGIEYDISRNSNCQTKNGILYITGYDLALQM